MSGTLDDLQKKLQNLNKNLGSKCAPKFKPLFRESVGKAIGHFYSDYQPKEYDRTYNFLRTINTAKTTGIGNTITMTVDSSAMSAYPGYFGTPLSPDSAFDYFYLEGEHGHGQYLAAVTDPPDMFVDIDVDDGFGGQAEQIIYDVIDSML